MHLTIFTLISTILWVSIFSNIISLLRKQMLFLNYFSIYPLLIILLFCILRLLIPIELPFTTVINSRTILPLIQNFFNYPLFKIGIVKVNLFFILIIIWLFGSAFMIFQHHKNYIQFKHLLNLLPCTEDQRIYDCFINTDPRGLLANAKIIVHNSIQSPAIFGLFRPVILLPDIKFSDNELLGIFIHESTHYKYGHYIIKYITGLIHACFWWNPYFKKTSLEIAHALEMQSDKAVCKLLTLEQQQEYVMCITKIAYHMSDSYSTITCNLVESGNVEKLSQRIKMILDCTYQTPKKYNFFIIPILILMFVLSYSIVLQPYSLPSENQIGENTTIDSNSYLIKTTDGYNLYNSRNVFIANIKHIDKNLSSLKVYEKMEDVKWKKKY